MQSLEALARQVRGCERCPAMAGRLRVPGLGTAGAAVFFLGEAPGRRGAGRTGVPFLGDRAGGLFWQMVRAVGLAEADVFVSNAVKCNPLDAAGRNRRPTGAEVAACSGHWRAELALVRPRLLVALGEVACRAAIGRPLAAALGRVVPGPGLPAFALYHPAYVGRHRRTAADYLRDWQAMRAALEALAAHSGDGLPAHAADAPPEAGARAD